LDEFTPLVGQQLLADCNPKVATLTLVEATPLRQPDFGNRMPFILIFRSEPDVLLLAGSYAMRCNGFGPESIYIAQMAQPPEGQLGHYYQAVFN
jgi:hypothetical protein